MYFIVTWQSEGFGALHFKSYKCILTPYGFLSVDQKKTFEVMKAGQKSREEKFSTPWRKTI